MSTLGRQSEPSKIRSAAPISDARRCTVEAARQAWVRKLIDLSRRNNLLYYLWFAKMSSQARRLKNQQYPGRGSLVGELMKATACNIVTWLWRDL